MKRFLTFLMSFLMIVSILSAVPNVIRAEDEEEETVQNVEELPIEDEEVEELPLEEVVEVNEKNYGGGNPIASGDISADDGWSDVRWTLYDDGELVIRGTGYSLSFDKDSAPFEDYGDDITSISISEGVNGLGCYTLAYLPNVKVIYIAGSVVFFNSYCFEGSCKKLETVNYYGDLEQWSQIIMDNAIATPFVKGGNAKLVYSFGTTNETSLVGDVDMPTNGVINCYTFSNMNRLTGVYFGATDQDIDFYAFSGCENLTTAWFLGDNAYVDEGAFMDCAKLNKVVFNGYISSFGDYAFAGCKSLKHIDLSKGVGDIGNYCFAGSGLVQLVLPEYTYYVGDGALSDCKSLKSVYIPKNTDWIGHNCFNGSKPNIYLEEESVPYTWPDDWNEIKGTRTTYLKYETGVELLYGTGKAVTPELNVYCGIKLAKGIDYTVAHKNNVKYGSLATVTYKGKGNYKGTLVKKYFIAEPYSYPDAVALSSKTTRFNLYASTDIFTYEGSPIRPAGDVYDGVYELIEGQDYRLSYINNNMKGTASAVVTGINECKGTVTFPFKITPGVLDASMFSVDDRATYHKSGAKPQVYSFLTEGVDYTVTYLNNKTIDDFMTVVIKGKGNFTGTVELINCTVEANTVLNGPGIVGYADDVTYNARGNKEPKVVIYDGTTLLKEGVDYTRFSSPTHAKYFGVDDQPIDIKTAAPGTRAYVIIEGNGQQYTGTTQYWFTVADPTSSIAKAKVVAESKLFIPNTDHPEYNDIDAYQVSVKIGKDLVLYPGMSYSVVGCIHQNKAGNGIAIIRGEGGYTGVKAIKYKIVPNAGIDFSAG